MKKFLKWLGIGFVVLVVIGAIAGGGDNNSTETPKTEIQETSTNKQPVQNNEESTKQETKKPNLELIEHTIKSDSFSKYVVGTIKNNTDRKYGYVQVEINIYDKDGAQIGSTMDNINNLAPGATWKFKAPILEDEAASYQIIDISGF
ncbi:hypothetical protein SAMN02745883_00735 [Caminicella sporogenes DSM 14501]|uniref:DUF3426 domain-containing protein n=1 Tax=Caminicella sporogenes DSM 14501 TaxID=1121266 RepID=A0A1M6N073_9FIRM|nr:FxLYD domain-containing protein [Caminicella sporogenes]RKD22417.1 hypothetical protein BET04_05135 [Caminicella sporogenes]SHJ89129.1 hypothetical protein SAMN02745883_00735 [Caminicella sporogenes DSM 14501]